MSDQGYEVAVVGAGMGGLATAGLLARAGHSVILVDRAQQPGGVSQGFEVEGHHFNAGTSMLTGFSRGGPLDLLCQRLNISLPVEECDPIFQVALPNHRISLWRHPEAWSREIQREIPDDLRGWQSLWAEIEALVAERELALKRLPPLPPEGWRDRLRVWWLTRLGNRFLVPARGNGILRQALKTPFRATMIRLELGKVSQRVLEAALWYILVRDPDECSTLEAAVALHEARCGVAAIPGGAATLANAVAEKFQRDGGQLRVGARVDHFLLESGEVRGLVMEGGEVIRARSVVADVPPSVLAGSLLPPPRGWLSRRQTMEGPWHPIQMVQAVVLIVPDALMPSEISGHCLVVRDPSISATGENMVFLRTDPAQPGEEDADRVRHLSVGRFVAAGSWDLEDLVKGALLEAVDQVIPGVESAMTLHRLLMPSALEEMWGRPSAAVRYATDPQEWLGKRGFPHHLGWPGLSAVGEWTYPGRTVSNVVEGGMQVADLIAKTL